jgi:hypothetical protein
VYVWVEGVVRIGKERGEEEEKVTGKIEARDES